MQKQQTRGFTRRSTMTEWHPLRSSTKSGSSVWESYNKIAEKLARDVPAATMPSLDHLSMKDYDLVYEPSDDTYLLLDGIQYEFSNNGSTSSDSNRNRNNALEIGCGSGVPIVYLGSLMKIQQQQHRVAPNDAKKDGSTAGATVTASVALLATDINPNALQVAQRTASENGLTKQLDVLQCDLASALLPRCQGCIDVVLFNPPYVPTPDDEVNGQGIEASWAGGIHGRRVIDRAIPQIVQLLSRPYGVCYMITVDDNKPEELAERFQELGLCMRPLVRRRACNEFLTVQKLTWV